MNVHVSSYECLMREGRKKWKDAAKNPVSNVFYVRGEGTESESHSGRIGKRERERERAKEWDEDEPLTKREREKESEKNDERKLKVFRIFSSGERESISKY